MKPSLLVIFLMSFGAQASGVVHGGGTGDTSAELQCSGKDIDGTELEFFIQGSAAPGRKQGSLDYQGAPSAGFRCTKKNEPLDPDAPTGGTLLWKCSEIRPANKPREGALSVQVFRGGPTNAVIAEVMEALAFPLQPRQIATLLCN